jgi:hypothetical protein
METHMDISSPNPLLAPASHPATQLQVQPHAPGKGISPADLGAIEAALGDMNSTFLGDLSAGTVGMKHNTFEHRSRVLRQLTDELALLRAHQAAARD